jgi:hypothetical protein
MFNHDDLSYVLHSNSYIRQRYYELPDPGEPSGGTFLAETTVDSDTGQSSVTGKVIFPFAFSVTIIDIVKLLCENYETESSWRSFLKQCDRLTRPDEGKSF